MAALDRATEIVKRIARHSMLIPKIILFRMSGRLPQFSRDTYAEDSI
jgi:hypothetical protein